MKNVAAFLGILAVLILGSGPVAIAQSQIPAESPVNVTNIPAPASEERVTLRVGDVFEIVADAGIDGVATSWILTQERTFIEAGRERLFRYRFVQDKEYTLRGEVTLPGTGERRQRTFIIDVRPVADIPTMPVYPAGTGASLAGTVPAPDANGRVIFTPEQQLLQLAPISADLSPLALDLDASRDADGDGNPGNDVDNTDTYFHSFGRSLWIWFAHPITQTDLVITAIPGDGSPLVQRISVLSEETAGEQGVLTSQVSIDVETIDDATYGFTPVLGRDVRPEAPLLFEWEFGDGERSLENTPTHSYAAGGTYDVKVQVRDLGTGNTVGTSNVTISVASVDPGPDEPDPIVSEPDPKPAEETSTAESLPWGRIILIGALFIGSLIVGVAIVWLLSFLRRSRKLEETLETMEKAVMPSASQTPPPLAIKSKPQSPPPSAQQKVIDAEINASSSMKEPPAAVTDAAAPDWLKKGLGSQSPSAKPTPAAATPPAPKPTPAVPPAPKPAPAVAPTPKPQAQTPTPAPQTTPPATKPTPSASPAPAVPKQTPTPTPAAPAQPKVVPAPAPKPQQATPTPPAQASVTPAAPPAPTSVTTTVAPKPAPMPKTVPTPAVTAPPKPAQQPSPSTATSTPAPDAAKLPHWLQPAPPAPVAPTPSPAPVAPTSSVSVPAATKPNTIPAAPTTKEPVTAPPKPISPAVPPMPIATPQTPAPAPMLVTPPPAAPIVPKPTPTPSQPILPQEPKDDDRPIAIIRADSIDPGPAA
jgi:hypothetical protein